MANCLAHRPIDGPPGDYGPLGPGTDLGMGWTHDYRDVTQQRGAEGDAALAVTEVSESAMRGDHGPEAGHDPHIGIPRIIRRRARWVSARLRHPRGR